MNIRRFPTLSLSIAALFCGTAFAAINSGYRGLSIREPGVVEAAAPGGVRVNTRTGNVVVRRGLIVVPGKGLPVEFILTYNSDGRQLSSRFGFGWSLSYLIRYVKSSSGNITVVWGDGRQDTFTPSSDGFTSPPGVYVTLEEPNPGELVLTTREGIRYFFSNRRLISIEDPNGNALLIAYDADQRLTSLRDAGGRVYSLRYDEKGRAVEILDSSLGNRSYSLTYDSEGRLTAIRDPLGRSEAFAYNSDNLITSITDRRGNRAEISYETPAGDPATRLPQSISKGEARVGFAFNRENRTTTLTDATGNRWTLRYDTDGRIAAMTDPAGGSAAATWDENGNLLSLTDRNSNADRFTYDGRGNLLTAVDPLNNSVTLTYEPVFSRPASLRDSNGNLWTFRHDARGNLVGIVNPLNQQTALTVDRSGQTTALTNPLGNRTVLGYDANGNLAGITDPLGNVTRFSFDAASRLTSVTHAGGDTERFAYDLMDQLTSRTDGLGRTTRFSYDASGFLVSITDPATNTTTLSYDLLDRLTAIADPLGNTRRYGYDAAGRRTSTTDARGSITRFSYNSLGRMTRKTLPLDRAYQFTYDNEGNLLSRTDPSGQTVTYAYDANNRLVRRTLPGSVVTSFTYDAHGNRLTAVEPASSFRLAYDALNRLVSLTDDTLGKTLSLEYDAAGRKVRRVRPEGEAQTFSYDTAGRLERIGVDGTVVQYTRDAEGRVTRRAYPNEVRSEYRYDAAGRITSLVTSNSGGVLQSYANEYDPAGNLSRETRDSGGTTMTYDAGRRLTRETRTGTRPYDIRYTWDANGNMLSASGTPFFPAAPALFTYDAANRMASSAGTGFGGAFNVAFTHDPQGNLIRRAGAGSATTDFTYDALNRLTSGADSGVGTERYTYDALGRRASVTVPAPAAGEPGVQRFFYDERGRVMTVYGSSGEVLEEYWHNDHHPLHIGTGPFDPNNLNDVIDLSGEPIDMEGVYTSELKMRTLPTSPKYGGPGLSVAGEFDPIARDRAVLTGRPSGASGGGLPFDPCQFNAGHVSPELAFWFELQANIFAACGSPLEAGQTQDNYLGQKKNGTYTWLSQPPYGGDRNTLGTGTSGSRTMGEDYSALGQRLLFGLLLPWEDRSRLNAMLGRGSRFENFVNQRTLSPLGAGSPFSAGGGTGYRPPGAEIMDPGWTDRVELLYCAPKTQCGPKANGISWFIVGPR